ncbi:MAG: glycosyltransferase family 2 protein [Lagierella massiliensis]|nr:glycosyltransferase family 2 protein [Lagierella massiliensis]
MISFVIPVFNEEETLDILNKRLNKVILSLNMDYEILYIDDGSSDNSLNIIKKLATKNIRYISFSRNFGKEAAILAGLQMSKGELVCLMDADLQHPPELIPKMLSKLLDDVDVVATIRVKRKSTGKIYNFCAKKFYKIMNKTGNGVNLIPGVQDFRIMKRQVVNSILELQEKRRFSKGIFNWVGYNTRYIEVKDYKRIAGDSKWKFMDSLRYGLDGIISFSAAPLDLAVLIGSILSSIGFLYALYIVVKTIILGKDVPGFATIVCLILLIGGINLIFMGVIGSYIGRIYEEVKGRPSYIIKEKSEDLPVKDE